MSNIPSTNDVTVAMIAAALKLVLTGTTHDLKDRTRKFQEAYKEVYEVVHKPEKESS